jgi:creatinine amidohydrolase/Fe(II)-dependent formamide hydrolase-like protein
MSKRADPFPLLENMTVKLVREYLKRSRSIILPLGVMGHPGRSNAALGRKLIADIVQFASERITAIEAKADAFTERSLSPRRR